MKISVIDKNGSGIMSQFAAAIGASIEGRFFKIPSDKGGGYITGFSWGDEIKMMIRNYYLNEEILLDRTNELVEGQDNIFFILSGIFPSVLSSEKQLAAEQPNVLICRQEVSSVLTMPSNTYFRSITIGASRKYLSGVFGNLSHPVLTAILQSPDQFAFETSISAEMIRTASEMLNEPIPESMESHYYRLKCEELLCYVIALLMQRDTAHISGVHLKDIKAIYSVKSVLQSNLHSAPDIVLLAKNAGLSEAKMRKLFRQTFGKGLFEYFQFMRMNEAARLLKGSKATVAEVGYQLGFTNMSHFSRIFAQHIGTKPKKYAATG